MTEKFNFDFFQIDQTGINESDVEGTYARTDAGTEIRRPVDMKISTFGALNVGVRDSGDYTKADTKVFKAKGDLEDVNVVTADTGIGADIKLNKVSVTHNPYLVGSTVKLTRDDQFFRMSMSRNTGSTTAATNIDAPMYDVMDQKEITAAGITADTNGSIKNWPSEGWKSFGKKYDFLPYMG